MATAETAGAVSGGGAGILDREHTVARAGFNRWLVPPAALCIHLCIGMSYGLSVFWLPLSRAIAIDKSVACPNPSVMSDLFTTSCDWQVTNLLIIFTIGIVMLGLSAAVFGGWLERAGPRKAGVVAALCWSGGFFISAFGVYVHQLWILWLGLGLIGGVGLGLGYISPVSTLVKWFPDRRGMATGMAIMGFGGGAMIGSPLANLLINYFKTPTSVGVWQTFVCMGVIYFVFMMIGAFAYRVAPVGWQPEGWTPPSRSNAMISTNNVHLNNAHKTPQFWLIWMVLCMNVSAGIGVLAMASPMLQEIFAGSLIGKADVGFAALDFFWASLSDHIGRKATYYIFFILGIALYASAPSFAHMGSRLLFVGAFCIILTMYGGGFATVPAYLADMFGPQFVGAIHGRLLTAWSTAGVVGPLLVGYIRDAQLQAGIERALVYDRTMYILSGLLVIGLICNFLIKPVADKWHLTKEEAARLQAESDKSEAAIQHGSFGIGKGGLDVSAALFWLFVGIPLAWGVYKTLESAVKIF